MGSKKLKLINIRVPEDLLNKMNRIRENEGITVTFQFIKGAKMYLKDKEFQSGDKVKVKKAKK